MRNDLGGNMNGIRNVMIILLVLVAMGFAEEDNWVFSRLDTRIVQYAVVVSETTYQDSAWHAIADTLLAKHGGQVFTHTGNVWDVQSQLAAYEPTHVCFVVTLAEITGQGSTQYVTAIHQMLRDLDSDPYGDAVWAILTGYDASDALRIAATPSVTMTNILQKDACWLWWARQGMYFACHQYGLVKIKRPDCDTVETYYDGPTDATDTLVTLINTNTFHLIFPGGHGSHNTWQLHYPDQGQEGFIMSSNGQVYGDPYSGSNIDMNSTNPKVFYSPYNCNHGQILNNGSFVPSWFRTGGACQFYGNTKAVGYPYMGAGSVWYLVHFQERFSFAEVFYLANQALLFCLFTNEAGTDPYGLNYDKDSWGFYGDPACDFRLENYRNQYCDFELTVMPGADNRDTVVFRITLNYDMNPARVWGQPVFDFLPFKAEDIQLVETDAHEAIMTDNFILLDIWDQYDPDMIAGEQRYAVFTIKSITGIDEGEICGPAIISSINNRPNPFSQNTLLNYSVRTPGQTKIAIYDLSGRLVKNLLNSYQGPGMYSVLWNGEDKTGKALPPGVYFCKVNRAMKKIILAR
jgi:hypothetical protein